MRFGKKWVKEAYCGEYPTALLRTCIVYSLLASSKKLKIIDLGCGNGLLSFALSQRHDVVGIDKSREMIASARKRGGKFICSDISNAKGKYDVVIAMGLIYHLQNEDLLFKKATQLLKRNGMLILSFRNKLYKKRKDKRGTHTLEGIKKLGERYMRFYSYNGVYKKPTPQSIVCFKKGN